MEVKLTDAGLKLLGFSPDRIIASVSTDRAYTLMAKGYANKDRPFMSLYAANHPVSEPEKPAIPVPRPDSGPHVKVEEKPMPKQKKKRKNETAASKRAAKREKAIKK